jgi:mannitol-1-phosphate 5-dehydrogenase
MSMGVDDHRGMRFSRVEILQWGIRSTQEQHTKTAYKNGRIPNSEVSISTPGATRLRRTAVLHYDRKMGMKTAVQFGAGNIGRGFMGQLFFEAGYGTVFVETQRDLVDKLNAAGRYPLRLLDAYSRQEIDMTIANIRAVAASDIDEVAGSIQEANVISTAVGVKNLRSIAPVLAEGIRYRLQRGEKNRAGAEQTGAAPVDIYLCENILDAPQQLKEAVYERLSEEELIRADRLVGFVGTTVARMVPVMDPELKADNPLLVVADSYHHLPFDGKAAKAQPPEIEGLHPVGNFKAEVERKLFVYNLGHAGLAYMGNLKRYTYVHETIADKEFYAVFSGALDESSGALLDLYPDDLDPVQHRSLRKDIDIRYGNPLIKDTIARVGRDPIRKLGPNDRLIGSLNLCLKRGIYPKRIAAICAAALCYDSSQDEEARRLQRMIAERGVDKALTEITGIAAESRIGGEILSDYETYKREYLA